MNEEQNRYFTAGFALALAEMNRQYDNPHAMKVVMECAGLTLEDFEESGVDEYDMTELKEAIG